jgi:succinyl-CoA synthetase beta subunit
LLDAEFSGQPVEGVLVERAASPGAELYLSVSISELHRCRRLVVARAGGSGFDLADADAELLIDPRAASVALYRIRNLLRGLGFSAAELVALAATAHGLVRCAIECQAYTAELNPVIGAVAVDAKLELDDYAIALRPADVVVEEAGSARELTAAAVQRADYRGTFRYVQMLDEREIPDRAAIGTHSVGGGESLVVLDALESVALTAANYCDTSGSPSREKVAAATELIASQPGIAGYFFSSCIANQPLSVTASGLTAGFDAAGWRGPTVVRIAGNEEDRARAIVTEWAAANEVDARVFGREVDEWEAARAMAALLS